MQTDFHYYATYLAALAAGFSRLGSCLISSYAEIVDETWNSGYSLDPFIGKGSKDRNQWIKKCKEDAMSILHHLLRPVGKWRSSACFLLLAAAALLLFSCGGGGDEGSISPQPSKDMSNSLEEQAIKNLVKEYRNAMMQEDIDRLEELLQTEASPAAAFNRQLLSSEDEDDTPVSAKDFRDNLSKLFSKKTITGLSTGKEFKIAADHRSVSFLEIKYEEDPLTLAQRTLVCRKTFKLVKQVADNGMESFLIAGVTEDGPHFEVTTPGRVLAGSLARVVVKDTTDPFQIEGVEIEDLASGDHRALTRAGPRFYGTFTPPTPAELQELRASISGAKGEKVLEQGFQELRVHIHRENGQELVFHHRYRLRVVGEEVVQQIAGTGTSALFAVAAASDGTVWAGGHGAGLYQISPASSGEPTVDWKNIPEDLLQTPGHPGHPDHQVHPTVKLEDVRVEDLVFDRLGRLHIPFLGIDENVEEVTVTGGGVLVCDKVGDEGDVVCDKGDFYRTVNLFDHEYPFLVQDRVDKEKLQLSPSTRACAAGGTGDGDIWLFGSDGGVAQVNDHHWLGSCIKPVCYDPKLYRKDGKDGLLSNTVPAMVVGSDDALWFGTAFGLTRWHQQRFTPVLFPSDLALGGDVNVETLEAFFSKVADAIFKARPISDVEIGVGENRISFIEEFGRSLIKEDLIFSALEDSQGRIWAGTLGGGLRRIEIIDNTPMDTLLLTRKEGLVSNIIFALAEGPDGSIWAATEEGVSRIQDTGDQVVITNFSALNGLSPLNGRALPVRDVAVDKKGTAWLATVGGLYRILPGDEGGAIDGNVFVDVDETSKALQLERLAVAGADICAMGTPYCTVTDEKGYFELVNIPPGDYRLHVDGSLASGGPYIQEFTEKLEVKKGIHTHKPVPVAQGVPVTPSKGGVFTFPGEPEVEIEIPEKAMPDPADEPYRIALSVLPLDSLPAIPNNRKAVAAVDLQPDGVNFSGPFSITLRYNEEETESGMSWQVVLELDQAWLDVLELDLTKMTYNKVGHALVIKDKSEIKIDESQGMNHFSTVVFAQSEVPPIHVMQGKQGRSQIDLPDGYTCDKAKAAHGEARVDKSSSSCLVNYVANHDHTGNDLIEVTVTDFKGREIIVKIIVTVYSESQLSLVQVSRERQSGARRVSVPFVVRVENQFGTPIQGVPVITNDEQDDEISKGETNEFGEYVYKYPAEYVEEEDIKVSVSAVGETVRFLTVVGAVDTDGVPLDLAVASILTDDDKKEVYVLMADQLSGLKVIDVGEPSDPKPVDKAQLNLCGTEVRLALDEDRKYAFVATNSPNRLYLVDIKELIDSEDPYPYTNPECDPDKDEDIANGSNNVVCGWVDFPEDVKEHNIAGVVAQSGYVYAITDAMKDDDGTLQILDINGDICNEDNLDWMNDGDGIGGRPYDISVKDKYVYVTSGDSGLLIYQFDPNEPTKPEFKGSFVHKDKDTSIPISISGITVDDNFTYLVETKKTDKEEQDLFTVLNLTDPLNPKVLGSVPIYRVPQGNKGSAIALAKSPNSAYIVQGALGIRKINIKDSGEPDLGPLAPTPTVALNTATGRDKIYVTDQSDGLIVFTENDIKTGDDQKFDDLLEIPYEDNDGTLYVDAATPSKVRNGNGEGNTPYRSITECLQMLQVMLQKNIEARGSWTIKVKPGTYSGVTTQEDFPLDLTPFSDITIQSTDGYANTVIDAGFVDVVFRVDAESDHDPIRILIEGLTIVHGVSGIFVRGLMPVNDIEIKINVKISEVEIYGNNTAGWGGGIYNDGGTVDLTNSTLSGNTAYDGGGIYNHEGGHVKLTNSTLSGNTAYRGGGIFNSQGSVYLTSSTLSGNTAYGDDGGGVLNYFGGSVYGTNNTLSGNTADGEGGGISNHEGSVNLTSSTLSGNTAGWGGGISSYYGGQVYLTSSKLSGNTAGWGGGISNYDGMVELTSSTLSGNTASFCGGGIFNEWGSVNLTSSTLSGNTADDGGGGISNTGGTVELTSSTLSENTADDGGGIHNDGGTVKLKNTIVAINEGEDCSGPIKSEKYNLDSDRSCNLTKEDDLAEADKDPLLGPLKDNGGPTQTHALLNGSKAIDAIPVGQCNDLDGNPILSDQRGVDRPQDGDGKGTANCDIGAFEVGDYDGDGWIDNVDNCPSTPNDEQDDADGDNIGDTCDNCLLDSNSGQEDADNDGIGDECDPDDDNDGLDDDKDNCPKVKNPDQEDADEDDIGDECDNCPEDYNPDQEDADEDDIGDECDNCPEDYNPDQVDADEDDIGDECDNCPEDYNPDQVECENDYY